MKLITLIMNLILSAFLGLLGLFRIKSFAITSNQTVVQDFLHLYRALAKNEYNEGLFHPGTFHATYDTLGTIDALRFHGHLSKRTFDFNNAMLSEYGVRFGRLWIVASLTASEENPTYHTYHLKAVIMPNRVIKQAEVIATAKA